MKDYTIRFPLVRGSRHIFDTLDSDHVVDVVRYNIKSTLLTCPGERPFHSEFGFCMKKYLFEIPTMELLDEMRTKITNQLDTYVNYIFINSVVLRVPKDSHVLNIRIVYTISEVNIKDEFDLNLKLNL